MSTGRMLFGQKSLRKAGWGGGAGIGVGVGVGGDGGNLSRIQGQLDSNPRPWNDEAGVLPLCYCLWSIFLSKIELG
jgi:hypothetical protein